MTNAGDSALPGVKLSIICEELDDDQVKNLLPSGSFNLISAIDPELLQGSHRAETLGKLISIESVVDEVDKRNLLLSVVPSHKVGELEDRVGMNIELLQQQKVLETSVRRSILGFFGYSTTTDQLEVTQESISSITPQRGLFQFQKRAASDVEKHLYFNDGRALLHLPTGTGKTRTAMSIVASHLRNRKIGLVVWLAATGELLEQASSEFIETWSCCWGSKS